MKSVNHNSHLMERGNPWPIIRCLRQFTCLDRGKRMRQNIIHMSTLSGILEFLGGNWICCTLISGETFRFPTSCIILDSEIMTVSGGRACTSRKINLYSIQDWFPTKIWAVHWYQYMSQYIGRLKPVHLFMLVIGWRSKHIQISINS